jgi:hypothetical protein
MADAASMIFEADIAGPGSRPGQEAQVLMGTLDG